MRATVVLLLLLGALLIGSSNALRKRTEATPDAPVLEHLEIPDVNALNTTGASANFIAADPNGVKFVGISFGNASYTAAQANWNATTDNTTVTVTVLLTIFHDNWGVFPITVTVCDMLNNCDTYDSDDLLAAGFQNTATIFQTTVTISCPSDPLSVLSGSVTFQCTFTASSSLAIVAWDVYAALYSDGLLLATVYPDDGNFDDPDATDQVVSQDVTFTLQQYAPNGTYTVSAEAAGINYIYSTATTVFIVAAEINDLNPPVLVSISIPSVTLPASVNAASVTITATDDATGIQSMEIDANGFGSGTWTSSNTDVGTDTSVSVTIPIMTDLQTLVQKLYLVTVTLCDKTNKCATWTTSQLSNAGFASALNIGPVNPNGNQASVTCGGPYNVANGPVNVTCTYKVTYVTGIYTSTVFVSRNQANSTDGPAYNAQAAPGYYNDPSGSSITMTSTQSFTLPQYAPYGNYTVLATTYDSALINSIVATTQVIVIPTTNDMGPPKLKTLSVPVPSNINNFLARVSANDDASGVANITVYLYSTGSTGVGTVNTSALVNNRVVTNANVPITMNIYNATSSIFFVVELMLIDIFGNKMYYSTEDLANQGFQANVTLLPTPSTSTTSHSTTGGSSSSSGFKIAASSSTVAFAFVFLLFVSLFV